jgi:hypothetical protein
MKLVNSSSQHLNCVEFGENSKNQVKLIQVDIGGHSPISNGSKNSSENLLNEVFS